MCRHQARLWECRVNKLNPYSAHRLRFQLGSHLIRIEEMWWGKHLESDCQRIHGEHIWNETSKCRPGKDLSVERSRQKNRENKGLGYVGRKKEGIKEQKEDQCCWNRRVSVWKRAGGELFRAHILKCGRKAFLAGRRYQDYEESCSSGSWDLLWNFPLLTYFLPNKSFNRHVHRLFKECFCSFFICSYSSWGLVCS